LARTQVKRPLREAFIHGAHTKRCEIVGDIVMIDEELLSGLYIVVSPLKCVTAGIEFFKNAWFIRSKFHTTYVIMWTNRGPSLCKPNAHNRQPRIHAFFRKSLLMDCDFQIF
jgi:hypothetical protein